jgi:hypothetical protein
MPVMRSFAATVRRATWPGQIAALVVGIAGIAGRAAPAAAHVAPSVGDNNRYVKLTPLGDRVRLAYTVFYGEAPGAELRKAIDANHDGAIDDAESQAFGSRIADQLAAVLELTVDGARRTVTWSQVVVGMGTPSATAGTFSIDLVASICVTPARGSHAIELRDRFELPHPGETEIRFEDSPGVAIDRARVGDDGDPGIDYKIIGPTPVLGTAGPAGGIALAFTAGPKAVVASDAACAGSAPTGASTGAPTVAIVGAAAGLAILAGAVTLARRRAR